MPTSKKRKPLNPLPLSKRLTRMGIDILKVNGETLRACCDVDPHVDPERAAIFYSGVWVGIGVTLKTFDRLYPVLKKDKA